MEMSMKLRYEPLSAINREFTLYKISKITKDESKFRPTSDIHKRYEGRRSLGAIRRKSMAMEELNQG